MTFQSSAATVPYMEVDLVLDPVIDFKEMYGDRAELQSEDLIIKVASVRHLIEIKSGLGRQEDLADVRALKKVEQAGGRQGDD